ncbi:MAG: aminotransferase class III-fold pyridoxal phosphate-dependent enzyme [Gammaproteobacteria bacterium]|nr:aminotransferase class III-fold pyridoxal phosphate-dependent enzyme [Gammaproteobacteria bacterium]MDD9870708.1 aminotransferase class III-fold pyridoxal phosphate-dependent enzyme [Gammaproteobacteria bacterium]
MPTNPNPAKTPSQNSRDYWQIAESLLPGAGLGGYSLPREVRFVIREGRGGRLVSVDGRAYVDFVCGAGATIIGHNHPAVIEAVRERAGRGMHFFGTLNDAALELAEELAAAIPCAERIIFTTTGSEATAYCMRIARAATGRPRVLKFEGAYHGNHDYAAFSMFPDAPAKYPAAKPDVGGVPVALDATMSVAPFNDLATVEKILAGQSEEIAAVMVEPVQRVIFPHDGFLAGLRELADRHGVLLIFDEVVTGFRLAYGGAQEYFGVRPDLASYGKIVGGGGPVGCVAGRADLLETTNPGRKGRADYAYINGTLHGNPVAAAAGLATLRVLQEPGFYDRFHARAGEFRGALTDVLTQNGVPAIIAGAASFWQFLFTDRAPANQMDVLASDMQRSAALDLALLRNGVYVLPNVRRFFSAAHDDADREAVTAALERACRALAT